MSVPRRRNRRRDLDEGVAAKRGVRVQGQLRVRSATTEFEPSGPQDPSDERGLVPSEPMT